MMYRYIYIGINNRIVIYNRIIFTFIYKRKNICYSLSSDTNKNVESTTKTLELAKMPNYTMVDDLLCPPGRQNRPPKIAIILRGPPGSGKSFVAKLIKVN